MATKKAKVKDIPQPQEVVDELPPKERRGTWAARLEICMDNPGRWARIHVANSYEQAQQAQSNLSQRKIAIPMPQGLWEFAARGTEVYAIYRGKQVKRRVSRSKT